MRSLHRQRIDQIRSRSAVFADSIVAALSGGLVAIVLGIAPTTAANAQGSVTVLPTLPNSTPGFSKRSGLQIEVDSTWPGSYGYSPVRVTLKSPTPVTSDTQITIRYRAGSGGGKPLIEVEQDFELQQGESSVTHSLLVPQLSDWYFGSSWDIWIDGVKDSALSVEGYVYTNAGRNAGVRAAVGIPQSSGSAKVVNALAASPNNQWSALSLDSDQLPQSWLGYTSLSVVVISAEEFKKFAEKDPDRLSELMRWVRSGGNLWVHDVADVDRALAIVSEELEQAVDHGSGTSASDGWRRISPLDHLDGSVESLLELTSPIPDQRPRNRRRPADDPFGRANRTHPPFLVRAYGMGTITAFEIDFAQSKPEVQEALAEVDSTLFAQRLDWHMRHGNNPSQGNSEFNNLLIPDVGTAPVIEFQLLITLFVVVIGPVNYWLLKRKQRLTLLLVTVPVAATVTTLLLLVYGTAVDGFGIRVRARSFTLLDQLEGEAVCWSRLSYYAGLAPGEGLHLATDTAVYPIHADWGYGSYGNQRIARKWRELIWNGTQHLSRGWLDSRTPTQYQTIAARQTTNRLQISQEDSGLKVINKLGVDVLGLVVQDHQGNLFLSQELPAGDSSNLTPTDRDVAMRWLRKEITDNEPELPAGDDGKRWGGGRWYSDWDLSRNLMETQIAALVSPQAKSWGNGTYIAITAEGAELSLGLEDVREEASFHLVRGTW